MSKSKKYTNLRHFQVNFSKQIEENEKKNEKNEKGKKKKKKDLLVMSNLLRVNKKEDVFVENIERNLTNWNEANLI